MRSFGADAAHVARHTVAAVEGLQSQGVAACAKHFPGHGDTVTDSHLALPRVDAPADLLEVRELEPFRAAVAAGVACVMTSHVVVTAIDPDRPSTFSPTMLGGVLRGRLGFDGVIVSDALDMAGASAETGIPEAAVRALDAGCDLLCTGSETTEQDYLDIVDTIVAAVESGRLAQARVADAAERVAAAAQGLRTCDGQARPCGGRSWVCGRMTWCSKHSRSVTPPGSGWRSMRLPWSCRWRPTPTSRSAGWPGGPMPPA